MAPINEHPCVATEHLILTSPRKFYKAYMHASHWQLRAFVHSPKPNHIHYLGWRDIYEVNTTTKVRRILGSLPYIPRCFTSGNGLLCCGGDDGRFAVIRLSGADGADSATQRQREVDDALDSIDRLENPWLAPSARAVARSAARSETPSEQPEVEVKTFGDQILNCINLWFPNDDAEEGTHNRPVAVIASNDHNIYIVDLQTKELVQKLYHEEPVNLGKISADGSLLVVVGDDPYMHIYKRKCITHNKKICSASDTWEWEKFSQTKLPGQREENRDDMRGSFAGSFSHRYLAVGTQYGEIAIFEIRDLQKSQHPKPTVVFKSTRPNTKEGAIRSLHFNPNSSLDLLAISEDSGRVVVVDVRQFGKRQTLETDRDAGYDEVRLREERDGRLSPDLLSPAPDADTTDDESPISNALVRQERSQARMSSRTTEQMRADIEALQPHSRRPSREEMAVLLAMQSERRRREEREREARGVVTPGSSEVARRSAPPSHERLEAINRSLGRPTDPRRTVEALESAFATHMAHHRRRQEARNAERRESGRELTESDREIDAREAAQAHAMAEMMATDISNARQQSSNAFLEAQTTRMRDRGHEPPITTLTRERDRAEREHAANSFFDPQTLRDRGMYRTANAVVRIQSHMRQHHLMEMARRERNGEDASDMPELEPPMPPFLRRSMERREPRMGRNRSPDTDANPSPTVRLPATSDPEPSSPPPLTMAGTRADVERRMRTPSVWGAGHPGDRYFDHLELEREEFMSLEEREARRQERQRELARRQRALDRERETTRMAQSRGWLPPEMVAPSERSWGAPYVRSSPASRNQTTGASWSPDGRTLYVGNEGGLYEYQVDVQNLAVAAAFKFADKVAGAGPDMVKVVVDVVRDLDLNADAEVNISLSLDMTEFEVGDWVRMLEFETRHRAIMNVYGVAFSSSE